MVSSLMAHPSTLAGEKQKKQKQTKKNNNKTNIQSVETSLRESLSKVSDWCDTNAMIIHPAKTKRTVTATRQRHQLRLLQLEFTLKKTPIKNVHEHRVLDFTIDDEMKRYAHLNNLCKTVSENVFLLSQLRHYVNAKTCKLFYSVHI